MQAAMPMADNNDEIYDVVDRQNRVTGQATRSEIHQRGMLHRSVHTLVFDAAGRLFLQKRSQAKDENPGLWDTSSAGHLDRGEAYSDAARRELNEELGIDEPVKLFTRLPASLETAWEHVEVYACTTAQRIVIDPVEISEGRYFSLSEIDQNIHDDPGRFTPTFRLIFPRVLDARNLPPQGGAGH